MTSFLILWFSSAFSSVFFDFEGFFPLCHMEKSRVMRVSNFVSSDKAVGVCDGRSAAGFLLSSFYIMLKRHCGCCVTCCRLCLFDVFCRVVEVSEHRCAEAPGCDCFIETCFSLDPLAHSSYIGLPLRQILQSLMVTPRKPNGSV